MVGLPAKGTLPEGLHQEEKRYQHLLQCTGDVILLLDQSLSVTFASPPAAAVLGLPAGKLAGKPLCEVLPSARGSALEGWLARLAQPDHAPVLSVELSLAGEGETRFFEGTFTNRLADPQLGRIVLHLHEVTRYQREVQRLCAANAELESFAYRASHDLRAPLANVLGLLQVMRLAFPGQGQGYLDMLERVARRMDRFISELIEYSRNGQTAAARVAVELDPLIRETWEDLQHMPGAAAIRFACQGQAGLRPLSDPVRLRIILRNLLSNAVKYHDPQKSDAFICVEVGENPQAGQFILRVQDNGQGIGEACREKVFDPFYRASHQPEGSGLGLHIVRQAVEKLGGTISLQTREKEGATFTVCLPGVPLRRPETP